MKVGGKVFLAGKRWILKGERLSMENGAEKKAERGEVGGENDSPPGRDGRYGVLGGLR